MPKATKIQQYSDVLFIAENLLAASVALEEDVDDLDGFEEDEAELFCDDISEILDLASLDWLEIAEFMLGDGSRGRYDQIPKSVDFFSVCLQAPDREFRHMFRIGRNMFDWLVATLSTNPIFMSRGRKPQRHVKYQLGCFLVRYGAIGSDTLGTAQKLSIGFGSVFLYCQRTTRAIRELRSRFVGWLNHNRKAVVSRHIENFSGFPDCLGSGDGSLIRFGEEPEEEGHLYMSRKKCFAINIQATCDHECRFTSYELGWAGAVTDVKIFKNSDIWQRRHTYFQGSEYIFVDKGYPSTPWTVRPFDEPEIRDASAEDQPRMREFNRRLSSIRISIEHTFGRLKGRFPSLRGLGSHKSMQDVYRVVEALIVLHNMAIEFKDKPDVRWQLDEDRYDVEDEMDGDREPLVYQVVGDAQVPARETDNWLKIQGRQKRRDLLDELF